MKKLYVLFLLLNFTSADAGIQATEVSYKVGDTILKGYLAYDDEIKGKRPAVLVVHEWWGHNEHARKSARKLAELGYTALAVDMYGDGKQANHPKDAGKFAGEATKNMNVAKARFLAAIDLLKKQTTVDPSKLAAIGYCFGGGVVLEMARMGVELDGVVSFHGSLATKNPAKKGSVKAKVLVLHGADDEFVTNEHVSQFKQEMKMAGVEYKLVSYPDTKHSFTNPDADMYAKKFNIPVQYNAESDRKSWAEMKKFFNEIFK